MSTSNNSYALRYQACKTLEACLPDTDDVLTLIGPDIWELDSEVRAALAPYFEQYEQGLVHSMEFFSAISYEINKARAGK